MLSARPPIDRRALLARLARGSEAPLTTVVTSSRRLAHALMRAFTAQRVAQGALAWETPDILPFAAWVERFWDDALYSDLGGALPLLLAPAQEQLLWEECIRGGPRESLLSVGAAAEQAMGVDETWTYTYVRAVTQAMPRSASP